MTAEQVLKRLRAFHSPREWAFFSELRVGTGYKAKWNTPLNQSPEQRMDAWAINLWPSRKFLKVGYEIKVSRSDFQHELKNPEKREQAMELSNQFYFVTPIGLVDKDEIPTGCGLIEVPIKGAVKITKRAPWRASEEPSWRFIASVCRRIQKETKLSAKV